MQEKIKLLDCEDKNFDLILEELNNQRREQEKVSTFLQLYIFLKTHKFQIVNYNTMLSYCYQENDEIKEQNAKAKKEHLAKISSLEENLKKIRNDKMEKSKNKGTTQIA